jgi:HlyD family secretion protein
MNQAKLSDLRIDPNAKTRSRSSLFYIFGLILLITGGAIYYAIPRKDDNKRVMAGYERKAATAGGAATKAAESKSAEPGNASAPADPGGHSRIADSILTVPGYIIARERIEISPRFMGVVKWIGVKKGDIVTNNQVMVLLDDAEYKAQLHAIEGRIEGAKVALEKAKLSYNRIHALTATHVESEQSEDDYRLTVEAQKALIKEIEGQKQLTETYIDWCVIRSPINGVVLEKLVDPNELVTPQSFGGTRGPSTALVGLADLKDLQVEIDLNEADVAKVSLGQKCKVSPEAYPDHVYDGYVAEKSPEANRQKGTLQVKVQIVNPNQYLTPELSAKVDFLRQTGEDLKTTSR